MVKGIIYAIVAYVSWGLLAIYWKQLDHIPAVEVLAHRFVWSFVLLTVGLVISRRGGGVWKAMRQPRLVAYHAMAAVLVGINWLTYVWAVNNGHAVETSLGYFINPLVSVALGVIFLRERLRPWQWLPVGLALIAVVYLTFIYGSLPWIALTLALSFGAYGLVKKQAALGSVAGLTLETGVLWGPALAYLVWMQTRGQGAFLHQGMGVDLWLMGGGIVTVVPLLCFAAAARRIPLSWVGLLQYIAPSLQFVVGIVVFHETVTPQRWIGFGLVWIALALFAIEGGLARHRREG